MMINGGNKMTIELNNTVSVKQVMEIVDEESGEKTFLIMSDDGSKWIPISQDEYNNHLRGSKDGE